VSMGRNEETGAGPWKDPGAVIRLIIGAAEGTACPWDDPWVVIRLIVGVGAGAGPERTISLGAISL